MAASLLWLLTAPASACEKISFFVWVKAHTHVLLLYRSLCDTWKGHPLKGYQVVEQAAEGSGGVTIPGDI